jgi:hypothetical protein
MARVWGSDGRAGRFVPGATALFGKKEKADWILNFRTESLRRDQETG